MKTFAAVLSMVLLAGCSEPAKPTGPTAAELEEAAMRAALAAKLNMPADVVARLRRLDTRVPCAEFVDDQRKVGFILKPENGGWVLDAMGRPPHATEACKNYDEFIQEQTR